MIAFEVAFDKLSNFETSYDIADYFLSEGIQGVREKETECPIAQWMFLTTATSYHVTAEEMYETIDEAGYRVNRSYLTLAMQEFVQSFDSGEYPDLILDEGEND